MMVPSLLESRARLARLRQLEHLRRAVAPEIEYRTVTQARVPRDGAGPGGHR